MRQTANDWPIGRKILLAQLFLVSITLASGWAILRQLTLAHTVIGSGGGVAVEQVFRDSRMIVIVATVAELVHSAAAGALSQSAAPKPLRGRYLAAYQISWSLAYAIAPFITMRCYEQIRVSLALLSTIRPMNVNLVRSTTRFISGKPSPTYIAVGRKGINALRRMRAPVTAQMT